MLGFGQTTRARQPHMQYRLVVGGYADLCRLWTAHAELARHDLAPDQLCAFRRDDDVPCSCAEHGGMPLTRQFDRLQVRMSSAELFDRIDLMAADVAGRSASWMPQKQADAIRKHLNDGKPLLMAQTISADQQVQCSRLQLSYKPLFLYTFNFAR
jgi:hypothetical protein